MTTVLQMSPLQKKRYHAQPVSYLRKVEQRGGPPFEHTLSGQGILLVMVLHIHQILLEGVPDVGVHAEGAVVLHDVEDDGLGRHVIVLPEVEHHYGLCVPLRHPENSPVNTMHSQHDSWLEGGGGGGAPPPPENN